MLTSTTHLIEKLFPYAYSITGQGNDLAIPAYMSELPFTVHEYHSGQSLNGWIIPEAWQVIHATIHKNGQLIYDGKASPLGVGTLSPSFTGELSLDALQQHLVSDPNQPQAIPYCWQNLYRPLEKEWFFSLPDEIRKTLTRGQYQINLVTQTTPSTMKVLDFFLPGDSTETILLNGHNCHPYQANDDISGCAVGIKIMQTLLKQKKRRYSYQLIIAPELHGPMFWLKNLPTNQQNKLKSCILLKSVGNNADLKLQHSYTGTAEIDVAAEQAMIKQYQHFEQGGFRTIYGNDETVFEAPPYNIPTISLTRWPFPQYHSNLDTPDTLDEQALKDTEKLTLAIIENIEYNQRYQLNFTGLVCLSAYGLYKSLPNVSEQGVDYTSLQGRWNKLMNCLPREIEDNMSVLSLAQKYQLPTKEVFDYLELWVEKKLLTRTLTK